MIDPRAEYTRRREERRARTTQLQRRHVWLGNAKVLVVVAVPVAMLLGAAWQAYAAMGAALAILLAVHEGVVRQRDHSRRAEAFYARALERLDGKWAGRGDSGDDYADAEHPYAQDLDVFGKGSLFERLSVARTRAGATTLARWLSQPEADARELRSRQEAVTELKPRLELREALAFLGEDVMAGVHATELVAWGRQPAVGVSARMRLLAAGLVVLFLAALVAALTGRAPLSLALAAVVPLAGFRLAHRRSVAHVVAAVDQPGHDLGLLASVLRRMEQENFLNLRLRDLKGRLDVEGKPSSRRIATLNRLVEALDSRDHLLVRIIDPFLLWTEQLAFAIEAWRLRNGRDIQKWLEALGELEALSGLASYSFERPEDPFPEFVDGAAVVEADGISHPLLSDRAVANDVRLDQDLAVYFVSGSNMSGKSTLLRTLGVNVVLALAGAPVCARRLRLTPMSVGASIRVTDSLATGISRFYAEVLRLKKISDLANGDLPLLFLFDELLHGTNSHDRRIGAEAVVVRLVERGALGLVTTHDLALTEIVGKLHPRAKNVHFEDHFEEGRIRFDYLLKDGVVQKSNALELMRSVGLDV